MENHWLDLVQHIVGICDGEITPSTNLRACVRQLDGRDKDIDARWMPKKEKGVAKMDEWSTTIRNQ